MFYMFYTEFCDMQQNLVGEQMHNAKQLKLKPYLSLSVYTEDAAILVNELIWFCHSTNWTRESAQSQAVNN